jgi:hypothetical protein
LRAAGIYWVKQHKYGMDFFNEWLSWHPKNIGHDQDGLNNVVGGGMGYMRATAVTARGHSPALSDMNQRSDDTATSLS